MLLPILPCNFKYGYNYYNDSQISQRTGDMQQLICKWLSGIS